MMPPSSSFPIPQLTASTPAHHSALLDLPPELLTIILSYLIQPKNGRIYLFIRRVSGLHHPPPTLLLRLATSGALQIQSRSQDEDENFKGPNDDRSIDDDNDKAVDNYAQTRHTRFNPPTLMLNRLFHTLTVQYMHSNLLLQIKLGHQLSADVTIRSRHCLRTTTKQRCCSGHEAYLNRLRATLQTAGAFRRVLVSVHLWNRYARTLPEQLDGVLDALSFSASPISKLMPSAAPGFP